ncbi:hypothetical protein POM88_038539 [Heracleum sosnowskyi]|uniref:Uncharacterized protein n=1 Tax=Heracleum sosnowskyi TaxID=360622 RepID=A0AAD8HAK6_9APIA|nr:hypothetical protein POM88_038539 [Heracleum sosnowskyi]
MAREIEKLHAELANTMKMARAAAAAAPAASPGPAYTAGYGNSDLGYTANSYAGPYAAQQKVYLESSVSPSKKHVLASLLGELKSLRVVKSFVGSILRSRQENMFN